LAPEVYQRAAARRDLIDHFVYLAETAGLDTAERFLSAARTTSENLAEHPKLGAVLRSRNPKLAGIRKWRVTGFENHLIFYVPKRDGISVVRVLHAGRDRWRMLGIQPD
jgi:toxin ParE1/3/4